ncbi:acyl CoA:acetate/3-ketoacid CoA transferase subunit alpha [Gottfriedia solisilvae]|uniref:Acyl CoA:acetate/3-ketoacid CoA transferase subunit alpha n=2 Tax=Gottfriedia solisilvae TaxID=1516104 RepID=A0A8J3AFV7_9BACI|nr:CoA transferase subunit A [Gottfriedia solisilvae]GGI11886.1 acyl CoA:acetate/3-ketoacid CoA transferase subunit alpha [Gottfriedia solisilvae]
MQINTFGKIIDIEEALSFFQDDMVLMFGGFGGIGNPPTLIKGILEKGVKNLTLIGNDTGFPDVGIGQLVTAKRVRKMVTTHIGSNPNAGKQMTDGTLDIEFSPQGTFIERVRAGGVGLGGVLVDIGIDSVIDINKQRVTVLGKEYLVETPLTADVSIVYAKKADPFGNLVFDKSARNSNPYVAMAGNITIVEVDEIVPLGALEPEEIIVPGAFVHYIVQSEGVDWKWVWEK